MAIGESTLGPIVTGVLSLDDVSLEGKTVLLRVDVNSPINPEEDMNTYKKTITKGLNIKPRNFRILSIQTFSSN